MDYGIIIQYVGYVVGIISTCYAIHVRRKLFHLQSKTEKEKAKSYRAKTEAEKARKDEHATKAIGNVIDWFRRNKNEPS